MPEMTPRSPGPVHHVSRSSNAKRRDERLHAAEITLMNVLLDWTSPVELPAEDVGDWIANSLTAMTAMRSDLTGLARAPKTEIHGSANGHA